MSGNYAEAAQILRVVPATTAEIDQIMALKARFESPTSMALWRHPADPVSAGRALQALLLHINDGLTVPNAVPVVLDMPGVGHHVPLVVAGSIIRAVEPVASTGFTVGDGRFYKAHGSGDWAYDRLHDTICAHTFQAQAINRHRTYPVPQASGKPAAWVIEAMRLSLEAVEAGAWLYLSSPEMPAPVMYTRPVVQLDDANAPHAERAPAIFWPDMPGMPMVYCSHGVRMMQRYVLEPEKITADLVTNEQNAEQRRELMRLMGYERYVREGNFVLLSDAVREFGNNPPKGLQNAKLWRKVWRVGDDRQMMMSRTGMWVGAGGLTPEQAAVLLELQNSSKEPDGTYKTYFLRVPPEMRKVADAAAWTFGMNGKDYLELAAET